MLKDFGIIAFFLLAAFGFIFFNLILSWLLSPKKPDPIKLSPYECGERVIGTAWIRFNPRFYVIALVFIIFEVEIAVLFPWAVAYGKTSWAAHPKTKLLYFAEAFAFIFILVVGLAYVWMKGDLEWVKGIEVRPEPEPSERPQQRIEV